MAMRDALDSARSGLDVKGAGRSHSDAAKMGAGPFAGRHAGSHDVAGAEAEVLLGWR